MARTYEGPQDRDGRRLIGGAAIVFAAPASSVYVALLFLAVSYASLAIRRERNLVSTTAENWIWPTFRDRGRRVMRRGGFACVAGRTWRGRTSVF
jgi:hypothetical protein